LTGQSPHLWRKKLGLEFLKYDTMVRPILVKWSKCVGLVNYGLLITGNLSASQAQKASSRPITGGLLSDEVDFI